MVSTSRFSLIQSWLWTLIKSNYQSWYSKWAGSSTLCIPLHLKLKKIVIHMHAHKHTHTHVRAHTHARAPARAHTHTHTHNHRQTCNCISFNMGAGNLPDMYAQSLRATGMRAEGIHIRTTISTYVTSNMYYFWHTKNQPKLMTRYSAYLCNNHDYGISILSLTWHLFI